METQTEVNSFIYNYLLTFSTEDDPGYSNRLSVGTLQGQLVRGQRTSRLVQLCTQFCWKPEPASPPPPPPPQGAAPAETILPLKQSRSYSALTQAAAAAAAADNNGKWSKNGYNKTTSRSTDDLIEEIKSKAPAMMSTSGITLFFCSSFLINCISRLELH